MPYRDPGKANDYQREYRRTRRNGDGRTAPCTTQIPLPFRLKTAADVLALLEEQVSLVRAAPEAGALEKARVVGHLAGVSLKAIEAGNLAARIEMLEAVFDRASPTFRARAWRYSLRSGPFCFHFPDRRSVAPVWARSPSALKPGLGAVC
jgi:hypothetical protein